MGAWVLDLSSRQIRVLYTKKGRPVHWHQVDLPDRYDGGTIPDPAEAGAALKGVLEKAGLKVKEPVIVLPPTAAVEMQVKLPAQVPKRDMAETVRSATSRVLGEQIGDTEIFWHSVDKQVLNQNVYVAAVRRDLIESIWAMCAKAGIRPGRILPYYLSLLPLSAGKPGFLLYDDGATLSALFVEHGAPTVGSRVGSTDLSYDYVDVWVSSLISLLAAAGVDPQLATAPSFTVLTGNEELPGMVEQIGYEMAVYPKPADWSDAAPWPAAALAWSAAQEAPKWRSRISMTQHRRQFDLVAPLLILLELLFLVELGLLGFLFLLQWPRAIARMEERRAEITSRYDAMKPQEDQLIQLNQLRTERQRVIAQNLGITPVVPFAWADLYTELGAVIPAGLRLEAVRIDTVTAARTQATQAQAAAPAQTEQAPQAGAAGRPPTSSDLTLTGSADSLGALSTFMERLTREPFSAPAIQTVRRRSEATTAVTIVPTRTINTTPTTTTTTPPTTTSPTTTQTTTTPTTTPGTATAPTTPAQTPATTPEPAVRYDFSIRVRHTQGAPVGGG